MYALCIHTYALRNSSKKSDCSLLPGTGQGSFLGRVTAGRRGVRTITAADLLKNSNTGDNFVPLADTRPSPLDQ